MKRNPGAARRNFFLTIAGAVLLLGFAIAPPLFHHRQRTAASLGFAPPGPLQLWYWQHTDLVSDDAVKSAQALIDKAAGFGYTGVAFWDSSFNRLGDPLWPAVNVRRLRDVLAYAAARGLRVMALGAPYGYSNAALIPDGNLVESQRVIGSRFQVDKTGKRLNFVNGLTPLLNAGFENGTSDWSGSHDAGIAVSSDVAHSGNRAGMIVDATGNTRFRQEVKLIPWRQYHLELWVKSQNFRGPANAEVVDWWHRSLARFYADIPATGTHDWTRLDYTFNSRDSTSAYLYFGIWGKSSGVIWFDDLTLEETALVYVVRRIGSPLRVYKPNGAARIYQEGKDYQRIFDPVLSPPRATFRDSYHAPVAVSLPPGTALHPGDLIAIDYYAAFPLPGSNQVGMCLTDEGVFRWLRNNARAIKTVMPPGSEILLSYDEMRQMNSCESCRAKHLSAGKLLAWNTDKVTRIYENMLPGTPLYVWNDMFDPLHNARKNYSYVEGSLKNSWTGLRPEVGILNWNHTHLIDSLRWFSGLNDQQPTPHRQIIAGYYDDGNGAASRDDLKKARGIPGIDGLMYVSWRDDYSQLSQFAQAAKQAWSSYVASTSTMSSNDFQN